MAACRQVEELGENRVRLTVDVSPHELEHAVEHAANDLAESVKIPGFRKGKVPTPVLLSNVGKDRIWAEAVESHIGGWFWSAAARDAAAARSRRPSTTSSCRRRDERAVVVHGHDRGAADTRDRRLDDARGAARRGRGARGARPAGARGAAQLVAELVPADDRPAQEGDTLVVDLPSPNGEAQSDTVVELGSGRLVEEIEAALIGASVGETRRSHYELARRVRRRPSTSPSSTSTRRCCRRSTTSSRARRASSTRSASCAADIEGRLRAALEEEIDAAFRAAAVDTLVRASNVQGAGPARRDAGAGAARRLRPLARPAAGSAPEAYFAGHRARRPRC